MQIERQFDPYGKDHARETKQMVDDYLKQRQELNQRLDPYRPVTTVVLEESDFPLKEVHTGDTHLAHVDSKVDGLQHAVDETGDDGLLVLQGNIIDSVSNKFISTNTINVGLNLDQQVAQAHETLRELDENCQVIVVGANTCHEGWPVKTSTHDPTPDLVRPETPKLYTGGQIIYEYKGEEVGREEVYHNSGKGRTQLSPEGSVRARSRELPFGHPERANVYVDAHMHQLTAAQDVVRNPVDRKDHITTFGEVGAAKGTKEIPDRFLVGIGVPPRSQPGDAGEGFVVIWRKNAEGQISPYPVAGFNRATIYYEAERLWEAAQKTGSYKDLVEQIVGSRLFNINPTAELNQRRSLTRNRDKAAKSEGEAPLYKTLAYDINSDLPVRIQFIGNLRVGSGSLERGLLKQVLDDIEGNPWAFYFATRRLVNQGTALLSDRQDSLITVAKLLSRAQSSLLGVMLTDELRSHAWGRTVKEKGKGKAEILYPGDWLYYESKLKGIPLVMPETVVLLDLKSKKIRQPYTLYLRDKLSDFTSLINPAHGLTRVQQVWGIDADALIGGHTEVVGWRTWMRPWGQLEVVVPGGFAEFMEKGVGSRVDYPLGGQGIILSPNKKLLYSFASADDGRDMHQALWLLEGLNGSGELRQIRDKIANKKMNP
jgi:hypothetical protein